MKIRKHAQRLHKLSHRKRSLFACLIAILVIGVIVAAGQTIQDIRQRAQAVTPLTIRVTPQTVFTGGSYTMTFIRNGAPFAGRQVDFDVITCPIQNVHPTTKALDQSKCSVGRGPWGSYVTNANGQIVIPIDNYDGNGGKVGEGISIVRYKPRGENVPYSNQVAVVVDRSGRLPVAQANSHPKPQIVPGSYSVFDNFDVRASNAYIGQTKVEYEGEQCTGLNGTTGYVQRYTKSDPRAYWGSAGTVTDPISNLRWCVGYSPQNSSNLRALAMYGGSISGSGSLAYTTYPDQSLGKLGAVVAPQGMNGIGGERFHYSLVPTELFPPTLTNTFVQILDRDANYAWNNEFRDQLDMWSMQVRRSQFGGVYQVRYLEWAMYINRVSPTNMAPTLADWNPQYAWNVVEDYDWNSDGTINQITRGGCGSNGGNCDLPIDCWKTSCDVPFKTLSNSVYKYTPAGTGPLTIAFEKNGQPVSSMCILPNTPYTLRVTTPNGQGYDGFLQIQSGANVPTVWYGSGYYPIYVNKGKVTVQPAAWGGGVATTTFRARQQLLTGQIGANLSLLGTTVGSVQPNNTNQQFSNSVTLTVANSCAVTPTGTPVPPTVTLRPTNTPIPPTTPPVTFTITGTVYVDTNRSGSKDTGEPGYAGVKLTLSPGTLSKTTDSLGKYTFTGVAVGTYALALSVPVGYQGTTGNPRTVTVGPNATVNFGIATNPTLTPTRVPTSRPTATVPPRPTATRTPTPRPTATPTRIPTGIGQPPTLTPTRTPTASPTRTPTAPQASNTPIPGNVQFNLTLYLHGIGKGGTNVQPNVTFSVDPRRKTRSVTIAILNSNNQPLPVREGTVTYDSVAGNFKGTVAMGNLPPGAYTVKVHTPYYLRRSYPGIVQVTSSGALTLRPLAFTAADTDTSNSLNVLDYNRILDCVEGFTQPDPLKCTAAKKTDTDITDDGIVNEKDLNLLLIELSVQRGDDDIPLPSGI